MEKGDSVPIVDGNFVFHNGNEDLSNKEVIKKWKEKRLEVFKDIISQEPDIYIATIEGDNDN